MALSPVYCCWYACGYWLYYLQFHCD